MKKLGQVKSSYVVNTQQYFYILYRRRTSQTEDFTGQLCFRWRLRCRVRRSYWLLAVTPRLKKWQCLAAGTTKRVAFWEVFRIRPFLFVVRAACGWRCVWNIVGMTGRTEVLWEKPVSDTLSTTNHKRSVPGIELGPSSWEAGDLTPELWHGILSLKSIKIPLRLYFLTHENIRSPLQKLAR
jgi:hypothetical protein